MRHISPDHLDTYARTWIARGEAVGGWLVFLSRLFKVSKGPLARRQTLAPHAESNR